MERRTPSKQRGAAVGAPGEDDHTDVTTPPAPWDGADPDDDIAGRSTVQTGAVSVAAARLTPTSQQAVAPDDYDLVPGTALGEYQIERRIGQGGMGVVFAAVHPLIGKRAAIKILKKELCSDRQQVQRFVDEARVVNQIGHPNIVNVFAFGEMPDGRRYFVMDWLEGETLRERVARGPLAIAEVSQIVRPLARALEAAHEKGVIHRDLKPDNVFLVRVRDELPSVKLLDFGIAKLARADHRVEKTATGAIVGTPQYIAPEQAKGYAIDHRVDIYALGGIVFELLTGRPPFVADNAMEMVAKHLMEQPVPPSQFAPSVPPELDALVLRMLAKDPVVRPSLAEACAVLERSREREHTPIPGLRAATPVPDVAEPGSADERSVPRRPSSPPGGTVRQQPVDAQVSEPLAIPRTRTPRALWFAVGGVPIVAIAAFLIVRSIGGGTAEESRRPVATTASEPPVRDTTTVIEPSPTKGAAASTASDRPLRDTEAMTPASPSNQPASTPSPGAPPVTATEPPQAAPAAPPASATTGERPRTSHLDAKSSGAATARPRQTTTPPRSKTGRLRLKIIGVDTYQIRIDGKLGSEDTELPVGKYLVQVTAPGRYTYTKSIRVTEQSSPPQVISLPPIREPSPPKQVKPPGPPVDDDKALLAPGTLQHKN